MLAEAHGIVYARASAAKALFDYLYLRRLLAHLSPDRINLAEALRLNLDEFDQAARAAFAAEVAQTNPSVRGSAKMQRVLQNLEGHVWRR
jgi:hypothetical protein